MLKPYIFTSLTSISHIFAHLKTNSNDFCDIYASKHGLQNLFNVQRLLTNAKNVIKLYLQRFLTSLYTYHIEITIHSSLNKHTPKNLSHILYQKK
jgi:hypothetical protein